MVLQGQKKSIATNGDFTGLTGNSNDFEGKRMGNWRKSGFWCFSTGKKWEKFLENRDYSWDFGGMVSLK